MHNGSAIFRIILVCITSCSIIFELSCMLVMQLTKSEAFQGSIWTLIKKYRKNINNLYYPISLMFLSFVEKQALLLENLTMEVPYITMLHWLIHCVFFVCGSEVDLVTREDPFCSVCHKRDMSQRRKSRELSGH